MPKGLGIKESDSNKLPMLGGVKNKHDNNNRNEEYNLNNDE